MAEKKILLVDDDPEFVEVTRVLLESHGYQVVSASSGEAGTQKAIDEKPDLIILDVMMESVTEGFDVVRRLRWTPGTRNIPIILLTAVKHELPWARADSIWLPVDVFLDKPVRPEELLREVRRAAP